MIRDLLLVLALAGSATGLILQFADEIDGTGFYAQPADDDEDRPEPTMYRVRYPSIIGVRG